MRRQRARITVQELVRVHVDVVEVEQPELALVGPSAVSSFGRTVLAWNEIYLNVVNRVGRVHRAH